MIILAEKRICEYAIFLRKRDKLQIRSGQFEIAILRHPSLPLNAEDLLNMVLPDLSTTLYERKAPLEAAPSKTDCLTSIYYLFSKALNLDIPLTFIGDMPRLLVTTGWEFHIVDLSEIRPGDLMFLKRKAESRLIVHAALTLNVDRIFHCKRDVGMVLETPESIFVTYEQQIRKDQLRYIDFRNDELRRECAGCYLKNC